ncbi:NIPSNAP family protein [Ideonella sp. YS5]|uniref:NIPSNAP family protein n=1 Tax=Ideonella sp. YS5 TaxID=3453714 RepID=UPI003EEC6551
MNYQEPSLSVIELRRYRMKSGRRDDLVALFEREFIEPQAAVGMPVLGIFREAGDPDRFTWLRGYASMATREKALNAFYGGPVWKAHREAANATMEDSDDVLLLRPIAGLPGLGLAGRHGPARDWRAVVLPLAEALGDDLRERVVRPWLEVCRDAGAQLPAVFETEPSPNNFPRLPVRSDGPVLVLLATWRHELPVPGLAAFGRWLRADPLVLDLLPTPRSPRA